ncbi:MAG: thiosulfate oxidation carrier protein SoxY [Betaproteobacteria bacterium]
MQTRRETLKQSALLAGMLASTGLFPLGAQAAMSRSAFDAKTPADVYKAMGLSAPVASASITITAPDIAENGAVVPVGAATTLPGVKQLLFLVEKNPTSLIAAFTLSDSVEATISTRTKMAQSCDVYAVAVMNDGSLLYAKKEVKVTLGGCGG